MAAVTLNPRSLRGDELVALSIVARKVGRTSETLKTWAAKYNIPVLTDPGGDWLGYQSWVDAVLAAAVPGQVVSIKDVTQQWWAARGVELKEVA